MTNNPLTGFFNVLDSPGNAAGDGKTDDREAIQATITAAVNATRTPGTTGNVVFLPAGSYCISPPGLNVPAGVTLMGSGWSTQCGYPRLDGSWIVTNAEDKAFSPVTVSGAGAAVRNIAFFVQNQDSAVVPADNAIAPATILIQDKTGDVLVEDIFLQNPYGGIYVAGGGRHVIRRVFGQPLQYGIKIDGSADTNYIDSIHFWVFWQPTGKQAAYQLKSGVALDLYHCDNPHISNVMAYNYNVGLRLSQSGTTAGASPHKVHLVNADFDYCITGIYVDAPSDSGVATKLQLANVTMQAPDAKTANGLSGPGIMVTSRSDSVMVQASNLRVADSILNGIQIEGDKVVVYGENVSVENWCAGAGILVSPASSGVYLGVGSLAPQVPKGLTAYDGKGQFVVVDWKNVQAGQVQTNQLTVPPPTPAPAKVAATKAAPTAVAAKAP